jgi:hypothetical protein
MIFGDFGSPLDTVVKYDSLDKAITTLVESIQMVFDTVAQE